ncbi:hypothetical protein CBR_g39926 [Chara braunii]|uniref:Uncharacterized protein n=1 Tax=Chara braunii TaxID=69332 RepID=A0A388K1I9_CHABU|nr:hypothetical protein CBR_g39926 [Chara braunii]|eukprot:GBG63922.1 hypothetical protein CBR_g39926 [Chara braunii]
MRQRQVRPDGTDGSDHEFRMVVDDRYKLAAAGKLRLRKVIVCQSFFYGLKGIWTALCMQSNKSGMADVKLPAAMVEDKLPLSQLVAVFVGAAALLIGTSGIRSSSRIALRLYMLMTCIAVVCSGITVKEGKYAGLEDPIKIIAMESSDSRRWAAVLIFVDALLEAFGMIVQISGIFVTFSLCTNLAPSRSK